MSWFDLGVDHNMCICSYWLSNIVCCLRTLSTLIIQIKKYKSVSILVILFLKVKLKTLKVSVLLNCFNELGR